MTYSVIFYKRAPTLGSSILERNRYVIFDGELHSALSKKFHLPQIFTQTMLLYPVAHAYLLRLKAPSLLSILLIMVFRDHTFFPL